MLATLKIHKEKRTSNFTGYKAQILDSICRRLRTVDVFRSTTYRYHPIRRNIFNDCVLLKDMNIFFSPFFFVVENVIHTFTDTTYTKKEKRKKPFQLQTNKRHAVTVKQKTQTDRSTPRDAHPTIPALSTITRPLFLHYS